MKGNVNTGQKLAKDKVLLGIVLGIGACVLLFPLPGFFPLLLFPLLIESLLIVGEDGVDLLVRILLNGTAGLTVAALVAGGVVEEAVHDDIAVDEDHLELKHLILIEIKRTGQRFELPDGSFGGGVFGGAGLLMRLLGGIRIDGLGFYQGMDEQGAKQEQDELLHLVVDFRRSDGKCKKRFNVFLIYTSY